MAFPVAGVYHWHEKQYPEVTGTGLRSEQSKTMNRALNAVVLSNSTTAGGVTVAGALKLAQQGRFRPDVEVVLCITGNGLKTIEAVIDPSLRPLPEAPVIAPRLREVKALVESTNKRVSIVN